jgi:putative endonuclease
MDTKARGDEGEHAAAEFLQSGGYHIVKRNLRCRSGEVDIVVYRDGCLVFIEVKHWLTVPIEDLERSITAAKRKRILGCAREFLAEHPEWHNSRLRFDIVHIGPDQTTHFEDAFTESGFQ